MGESKRCQRARLDDVNGGLAHLRRHSGKGIIESAQEPRKWLMGSFDDAVREGSLHHRGETQNVCLHQ
jgi:hypothetical protein